MNERVLQRYRLLEEVGQGGMAVVYKGLDTTLNREVAVKVLHPHLAGHEESRARLQREAHAVAKLRHENILEIFDYSGPDSPESYIVTEFIHGQTLKLFLNDHPLPFPEVAEMIASEVARALEHAHSLGVIHRDVKPENVMIRDDGLIKLMDFGIAQIVDKERMTVTGQLLGSPAYMAPEHVEGRPLDFRTDVFAVGILTYQLATGQLPFRGKNPHEVLKRIAECKFTPPGAVNPLVGARLGRVIKKALEREPQNRFADVAPMRRELLEDLADVGVDDPRLELQRFFADPKGWAKEFRPRLVSRLTARGRELRTKGRTPAALELWGRALSLEPKSSEVRGLLDGVARRRQLGRAALAGSVLLAVTGLGAVGARYLLAHPPAVAGDHARRDGTGGVDPNPIITPSHPSISKASGDVKPPVAVMHHTPVHVAHPPPHVAPTVETAPPPPPAETLRAFRLAPVPQNVNVALDGKPLGPFDPANATLQLTPGPHVLHFSTDACFSQDYEIAAGTPAKTVQVHLGWKPAFLVVNVTPSTADVMVDNKAYRSGQRIQYPLDNSPTPHRTFAVKVMAEGYESQTLDVTVDANGTTEQAVALKKTGG